MDRNDEPGRAGRPGRAGPDLVGILTLLGLIVLGLACLWLVPWFMHVVKHQDCIGSGATNC